MKDKSPPNPQSVSPHCVTSYPRALWAEHWQLVALVAHPCLQRGWGGGQNPPPPPSMSLQCWKALKEPNTHVWLLRGFGGGDLGL